MRIHIYRTYRWVDKSPTIDAARTAIEDEGLSYKDMHELSGSAVATFKGYFVGDTREPRDSTITNAMGAIGRVRRDSLNRDGTIAVAYVKARDIDFDKEIKKQADWLIKQGKPKRKRKKKAKPNGKNGHAP